ncbi:hypothetical protein ES708_31166 [subsurface metagenome]
MGAKRDTYKYHVIKDRKVVHRGITDDLERREGEQQEKFKDSHIKQIGRRTTREKGLAWERRGGKRTS